MYTTYIYYINYSLRNMHSTHVHASRYCLKKTMKQNIPCSAIKVLFVFMTYIYNHLSEKEKGN